MALLKTSIRRIFSDIHPSWKKIILSPELKPFVDKCLMDLDADLSAKGVTTENIRKNGLAAYIRPAPQHIFECFKYFDANNLRAIIIGQDPYPDARHAHGLSFSSRAAGCPASLKNVYKCLVATGMASQIPDHGDLTCWAKQGVLMLNTMLTRTPNIIKDSSGATYINGNGSAGSENKHPFWLNFTKNFLTYMSTWLDKYTHNDNKEIIIMLWGGDAQKLETIIDQKPNSRGNKFTVHKWGHPSSLNRVNNDHDNEKAFVHCDHFSKVLDVYPQIVWDPNFETNETLFDQFWHIRCRLSDDPFNQLVNIEWLLSTKDPRRIYDDTTETVENNQIKDFINNRIKTREAINGKEPIDIKEPIIEEKKGKSKIVVFTDGGCTNNGKQNARAALGVYFPAVFCNQPTATPKDIHIGQLIPGATQRYDVSTKQIVSTNQFAKRTNQRAELSACIYAFKTMYDNWDVWANAGEITSILFVTDSKQYVMSWLGGRLWREYAVNKKFEGIPNADLVTLLCRYVWMLGRKIMETQTGVAKKYSFDDVGVMFREFMNVKHQYSHLTKKQKSVLNAQELEFVGGNEEADKLCGAALEHNT